MTSEQLSLELVHTLRYAPANFVVHAGVAEVVGDVEALAALDRHNLVFVENPPRSGKTHLAVYLDHRISKAGRPVTIVDGHEAFSYCESVVSSGKWQARGVVIVDDAEHLFTALADHDRTPLFVQIVDLCAASRGMMIFLSGVPLDTLCRDAKVTSRLRAGIISRVTAPLEEDLDPLLTAIAKQRGLLINEGKRAYVLKRVARDIPGLVDCAERIGDSSEIGAPSTSFQALSEVVSG